MSVKPRMRGIRMVQLARVPRARAAALAGSFPALPSEGQGHGGRGDEAAEGAHHRVTPRVTQGSAGEVPGEVEAGEDQDDDPELARADAAERLHRSGREEGKNHQREHGEGERRAHLPVADPGYEGPEGLLLGEQQDDNRGCATGQTEESEPGEETDPEHQDGRHLGGAIDRGRLATRGQNVGGNDQGGRAEQQAQGERGSGVRSQPAGDSADGSEEGKGAHAGKARGGAGGMARPFALEADGHSGQRGYSEPEGGFELSHRGENGDGGDGRQDPVT